MRLATLLLACNLASTPALADSGDTGDTGSEWSGYGGAADLAGDSGGAACAVVNASGLVVSLLAALVVASARRRE